MPSDTCQTPSFPAFELRLEDDAGNLIQSAITPGVEYAEPPPQGYKFTNYGFNFTMPSNINRIVIKITLFHEGYDCGEDFAIDDIEIAPYGPKAQVTFTNEDQNNIVKSVCYQDNKTISMSGSMGAYYPNPALQWQQSIDSGLTWIDIPGATSNTYSQTFSTPDTFLFRLSGSDIAQINNPNCRVISNIIKVEVDGPPSNFKVTNNSPLCAAQDLEFDGEGGASYAWSGPNNFFDNIQSPHIPNVSVEDSGIYNVHVTSLGGCTATATTHVIIKGTNVHASPDTSICNGSTVTLHASAGTSYAWSPADGLSNTTIQNPKANPTATTTYIVNVTSTGGCSDTAKATVKVIGDVPVKASFSGTQFLCKPVDTATFTDMSAGQISSWQWNFGNGQTSIEQTPSVVYYYLSDNTSTYTVSLKVADSIGCTDSAFHTLKVEANCYIAVPSAFTPNGDRLNDYLYPLNAYKATNLTFRVYNRFGELILKQRTGQKNGMEPKQAFLNQQVHISGCSVILMLPIKKFRCAVQLFYYVNALI